MKLKKFILVTIASIGVCGILAADAPTPDETYIAAKRLIDQGDGLKANGNPAAAKAKYEQAQKSLKTFPTKFPGWNTRMVQYRLEDVTAKLREMEPPVAKPAEEKAPRPFGAANHPPGAPPDGKGPPPMLRPPPGNLPPGNPPPRNPPPAGPPPGSPPPEK